ncbi:hypothetical protein B0O99DRAFT_598710 [Bisporella sp. PMI_857]|nr:hypothetical protein B0O99DRAFT_598710 [Bisporella sp. PMI_857]
MAPLGEPELLFSDSDLVVEVFNGAVSARQLNHPNKSFALDITLDLEVGRNIFTQKPPVHFHVQEEYIEALEGKLGLEIEGKELVLSPADGTFRINPFVNHRSYPLPEPQQGGGKIVRFRLSGEKTSNVYELSPVFFENWYKCQNDFVVNGARISLFQVLSTFDAGGSYLSFPSWVPFGQSISRIMGVLVGRWIGGLLGYQPFYRKWTTDWDLACDKMESSIFQRRFADRAKTN